MRVSRFSVHRPIFTTMVVLIVIILGGISLSRLPVDLMPDITSPTLSISTEYTNASPEEMEELVTRLIEEAMSAVPGVEEVSSASSEGSSNVRVTFAWGTDMEAAANDIRDRLDRVMTDLQDFFRSEMERNGHGPMTSLLERDADGRLVSVIPEGSDN